MIENLDPQTWEDWKKIRKQKGTTPEPTKTVLLKIEKQAAKLGWTLAQAIQYACENEWKGFRAEWVKQDQQSFVDRITDRTWAIGLDRH